VSRERKAIPFLSTVLTVAVIGAPSASRAQTPEVIPAAPPTAAPAQPQAAINVTVNGEAVPFPGQGPIQQGGTVLVPLRGVFEKLGATVQYEAPTKTIIAVKGATTVTLRLGDATAYVNGAARPLAVPAAATSGATLVPLRFVSEALGASVKWESVTRVVQITTGATGAAQLPEAPTTPSGTITGTLTGIFPESNTLTIRVAGGENTQVKLTNDTVILSREGEGPGTTVAINALRPGDQAKVQRDAGGNATVVEVLYTMRQGEVKSIQPSTTTAGGSLITLTNGTAVEVIPGAPVTMSGNPISLTDIKPGERVFIRINPQTKQGLGVSVGTADNPNPVPMVKLEISALALDIPEGKVLRDNENVGITVTGTPGSKAFYTIPGLANALNQPLTETAPGTYTGSYVIINGLSVKDAVVTVLLTLDENKSEVKQSKPFSIDSAGPELSKFAPAPNAEVDVARPELSVELSDKLSGVDPEKTHLLVNDQDVTAQAKVTTEAITYTPKTDLEVGDIKVSLVTQDKVGNTSQKDWKFTVTPNAKPIVNISVTPPGLALNAGEEMKVYMTGLAGGQARFAIGDAIKDQPLIETMPGTYTGSYFVKRGEALTKAPVTVTFTPKAGGPSYTQAAPQVVTFTAGPPRAPIIDAPAEDASVGNSWVMSGRAAANSTVRIRVKYQGRLIKLLSTQGNLDEITVKVGPDGKWQTTSISVAQPIGASNIVYTAEVVVVTASGDVSTPATVRFKR
jgi:hypothetical protein